MSIEELKKRRQALHMSRETLAQLIGVRATTIYRWESGRQKPHSVMLRAWDEALTEAEAA